MYRETVRTRANAAERRARIERAARHVVARGGFSAASISAVSAEAGCSAGLVYSYFANRDELLGSVFAHTSGHELAVVEAAVQSAHTAGECVDAVVRVFVERAIAGRTLAYALLFEPVPETVQRERTRFRTSYAEVIAAGLQRCSGGVNAAGLQRCSGGVNAAGLQRRSGGVHAAAEGNAAVAVLAGAEVAGNPAEAITAAEANTRVNVGIAARSLVGAIAENLYIPLNGDEPPPAPAQVEQLITEISRYSRSALGAA